MAGLCAAIIFIGISLFRINLPAVVGKPFIHFGNTFAVVGTLILGGRYGSGAAMIGLGLFDILNGYAATAWLTIIEALVLCLVVAGVFRVVQYRPGQIKKLYLVSAAAGLIKLVTSWMTGIVESMMVGTNFFVAAVNSFLSLPATAINSVATFILVPIVYIALEKTILRRVHLN
ncbi:ECF transporter S component [Lactobacillus sp. DCY120]|uniref:ECF transporter S component n=2 Tax=Bombilactobacillus apium TaxID=2675299 RepID=A0A850RC51_9LACO|nr:ECF transporter S component [Bombilactobacillus apium]